MFIKIPFESDIEFKTNIYEITKMSLEHEFNVNDGAILGNFYISGEYRTHEVSMNKEPFNYTLPFTVELRDDLRKDSLEFNIEDFTYEVDKNILKVKIEYSLSGELEEQDLFERVNEDELESDLAFVDDVLRDQEEDKKDEECIKEEVLEKIDEVEKENEENEDKVEDKEEERIGKEEEKTIMETIKDSDDTFVTYHVHIVKESETIESISSIYNVPTQIISEYNDIENIATGDKILIPKNDE